MTCCASMEFYETTWAGAARFADPACLIHASPDGKYGIIVHDGSGRYSIISYCPWCGAAVGPGVDERLASEHAALGFVPEGPAQGHGLPPGEVVSLARPPAKHLVVKGRRRWTQAERDEASVKAKARWAERMAAASAAATPSGDDGA